MYLFIFTLTFIVVQAKYISKGYCEVTGDNPTSQCYTKETLVTMAHSPHQLALDNESNTLFFSFDSGQGEYIPALYKIDSQQLTVLKGVRDAFAIAYDPMHKEMYFGGTHGIYKFNTNVKSLKRLNINNLDIWWLFVKTQIYFIKFPSLNAYSYLNGSILSMNELSEIVIHQMVLDVDDNIFFTNNSGLYGMTPDNQKATLIKENPRFINLAVDHNGFVYVCSDDGIYVVNKMVRKLKKLVNINGVLGFTFDKDNNIIYSDSHDIIRLLPLDKNQG